MECNQLRLSPHMADVYIIYAKENRDIAVKVHDLLSKSWTVWMDDLIVGDFATAIKENLQKAACVVALYSESASKPAVTDELRFATKYGKKIIPLQLDDSDPPYSFGNLSTVNFQHWSGEPDHEGFKLLQVKIQEVVPAIRPAERLSSLESNTLAIPNIFMSVSSHETQFKPAEALRVLKAHGTKSILVSAYDLRRSEDKDQMIEEIKAYRELGGFVLIDSGNYEADRTEDETWTAAEFHQALLETPHDCAFCFDNLEPSSDLAMAVEEVIQAFERDRQHTSAPVYPIVHVSQDEEGLKRLPDIVFEVANRIRPGVIAIAERELGPGLALRARTMKRVRAQLQNLPFYQPIHLLGTGNPWSISVLVAAGADTFDGLEWCRFSIDPTRGRLHHFQHFDFFKHSWDRTPLLDIVDTDPNIKYAGKVALYNLEYYAEFGQLMQSMIASNDATLFATGIGLTAPELKKLFPEIFQ